MSRRSQRGMLSCSFCKKSQRDVRKLVAGTDVFICDECIVLCVQVICEGEYELAPSKRNAAVALAFLGGDQSLGLLMHNTVDPEQLRLKDVIEHIVTEGERFTELKRIARHQALIKELDELEQNLRDPEWPADGSDPAIARAARVEKLDRAEELRRLAHALLRQMQSPDSEKGAENTSVEPGSLEIVAPPVGGVIPEDCLCQIPPPPPDDEDQP
jgi:hypothetical protein